MLMTGDRAARVTGGWRRIGLPSWCWEELGFISSPILLTELMVIIDHMFITHTHSKASNEGLRRFHCHGEGHKRLKVLSHLRRLKTW